MKKVFSIILIAGITLFFLNVCIAIQKNDVKVLTLNRIIKRALLRNPSILSNKALIEAAEKEKRAQWGGHLPRINITGQASRTRYPTAITPIGGVGHFPHFSKDSYLYNIDLEFPIYEGGRISKRVKIADIETSIRESLEKETVHDLIANIKDTFYFLKKMV